MTEKTPSPELRPDVRPLPRSAALLERARRVIPGGVNSPVRAFRAVGGTPPFFVRGSGAYVEDADGHRYVDFVGSWGPMIHGHASPRVIERIREVAGNGTSFGAPTELEIEMAEEIVNRVPGVEMVRLVSSGTEATMSAIRVARGHTGRDKFVKFDGCYHGHGDGFLIAAGSGAATLGTPSSPGVPAGTAADTILAKFNDLESVEAALRAHPGKIAAIIVEPICGNAGCIPPTEGFLEGLAGLCREHGALLVFDEVMTGFRVHRGGAGARYGVVPDLVTYGKVIGGGLPVGAYGGRKEIMQQVAPAGPIYQAGTLSGNPLAVASGLETLRALDEAAYDRLEELGAHLERRVLEVLDTLGKPLSWTRVGSMFSLFFTEGPVRDISDVAGSDLDAFARFFHAMLRRGVYLAPSAYEAGFLGLSHDEPMLDDVAGKMEESLREALT